MPSTREPSANCSLCPRLAAFRSENRLKYPGWFNSPVPAWGDPEAALVIVGLAPGLQGANRTGRPFTGDYAGDLLFKTLAKAGMAVGSYQARPDDGLTLQGAAIVNAVRCVPPQNKPTGPEIGQCRQFLIGEIDSRPKVRVFLALGRIAHDSFLTTIGARKSKFAFAHGARHDIGGNRLMFDSYHCSRYNTNTGVLTEKMFESVVFAAAEAATN